MNLVYNICHHTPTQLFVEEYYIIILLYTHRNGSLLCVYIHCILWLTLIGYYVLYIYMYIILNDSLIGLLVIHQ